MGISRFILSTLLVGRAGKHRPVPVAHNPGNGNSKMLVGDPDVFSHRNNASYKSIQMSVPKCSVVQVASLLFHGEGGQYGGPCKKACPA